MSTQQWWRVVVMAACVVGLAGAGVGQPPAAGTVTGQVAAGAAAQTDTASDLVTINVDDAPVAQVMNAFSRQTGRSIVVAPEVTGKVTARLSNTQWRDALDAILKPYGYAYYLVGDTVIVCAADKLPKPEASTSAAAEPPKPPEPLLVQTFQLKYLDASDVEDLVKAQLTPQGRVSKLVIRSQSWQADTGWTSSSGGSKGASAESLGRLRRISEEKDLVKGKTLVVVDTKAAIDRVVGVLAAVDVMPAQVLIEAKFIEVRSDFLRDIGVEFGSGANGAESPGVTPITTSQRGNVFGAGVQQISGTVKPSAFEPQGAFGGVRPFDGGMSLVFQKLTEAQFEVLLHMMQEDRSYNVLSSPQIMTMNNQDATIIVGQKFPIINSQTTASGTTTPTISTSLEYYENIGVQLKVLPQVCEGDFINLIVHPSVREQVGLSSGKIGTGVGANVSLTEYPVLSTREAETQIMMKSGQTVVIGGLLKDRKVTSVVKVPNQVSIPLLGVLFRRETVDTEKTELLIFLTATVRGSDQASPAQVSTGKPGEAVTAAAAAIKEGKTP